MGRAISDIECVIPGENHAGTGNIEASAQIMGFFVNPGFLEAAPITVWMG